MTNNENQKLKEEVGRFSYKMLIAAKDMVKPGVRFLDVAEKIERLTREGGFECAFPINLSVNEEAAHYTPSFVDEKAFSEHDLVKVDFGVAKNGILGDCAVTVDLSGGNSALVEAAQEALANAISTVKAGVEVHKIGAEIMKTAEKHKFQPVMNLGGHGVAEHDLHSEPFIPNYDNGDDTVLEEGEVIAIEPFITNGKKPFIVESDVCEIYSFFEEAPVRSANARLLLKEIMEKYGSEPFAARWLGKIVDSRFALYAGLGELIRAGALEMHPVLTSGVNGDMIAQAEAQVLVTKDGCEVLTK